jgi:acid-sensing ion channel, other
MKLWKYFTDYSNNTSIQGVKYLGEKNRHVVERIFWIISIIICSIFCTITIYQVYQNWKSNPILMTFSENFNSISEIPFPSVTICPSANFNAKTFNFTEYLLKFNNSETTDFSPEQLRKFEAAIHLCFSSGLPGVLNNIVNKNVLKGENILSEVHNISMRLNETMVICTLRKQHFPCSSIFEEIITETGICFTSNMINFSQIIRQKK